MMIRKYVDADFSQVKNISTTSFSLTPFHVDSFFSEQQANEIIWEQWTRPAVESEKKHCFVSDLHGEIMGFIVYGGYKTLSEALGKKIASIILLAVKEELRNSTFKVGTRLVAHVMNLFRQNGVDLVTVGTDLANLPAIHLYEKSGFKKILEWATFRSYQTDRPEGSKDSFSFETIYPENLPCLYCHPIAFLHDSFFSQNEKTRIEKIYQENVLNNLKAGSSLLWRDKEDLGYAVIEKETTPSKISCKEVFRINRMMGAKKGSVPVLAKKISAFLASSYPGSLLECYVPSYDMNTMNHLYSSGFSNIHTSVTLHAWL